MVWQSSRFSIDLASPKVMGIVNLTPDSFSDGAQLGSVRASLRHCERLIADGAHILDIGAESTRPGAMPVPVDEELARLLPVLREAVALGVPVSVDTYKPAVMQAALELGADIINDVWGLRWSDPTPGADPLTAVQVLQRHGSCGVCLMHMHGEPQNMQASPMRGDVVAQVLAFWQERARALQTVGVEAARIVVDPGIGFGKTVAQNFALLARLPELLAGGFPVAVGWSRKSSLAAMTGNSLATVATLDTQGRMVPSVAAALLSVERGARLVRVHDVRETVQVLKVLEAVDLAAAGGHDNQGTGR